jgi:hypothetical protein
LKRKTNCLIISKNKTLKISAKKNSTYVEFFFEFINSMHQY